MTRRLLISYLSLAVVVLAMLEVPLGFINARGERAQLDGEGRARRRHDRIARGEHHRGRRRDVEPACDQGARAPLRGRHRCARRDHEPEGRRARRLGAARAGRRSFATRPEFRAALRGDVATGTRHSSTLGYDLLYVAVPIASGGTVHGAVRITYPTSELDRRVRNYWLVLAGIAAVVLAAAALIGLSFARWIRAPARRARGGAAEAGAGDLGAARAGARRPARAAPARPRVQRHGGARRRARLRAAGVRRGRLARAAHAAHGAAASPREPRAARRRRRPGRASPRPRPRSSASRGSSTQLLALARADAGTAPAETVDLAAVARGSRGGVAAGSGRCAPGARRARSRWRRGRAPTASRR